MRVRTRLFVLPFLVAWSAQPAAGAQAAPTSADGSQLSVRWNRLMPRLVDEATARRRAARLAAAGDSAALRRLQQGPPPILFRVYTLLSIAQYGAARAASDPAASSDAAIAAASATMLTELFPDSAVRASIARELARDLDRVRSESRGAARAVAGARLGEDIARRVIALAPPLDFADAWKGTVPTGPGMWRSAPGRSPDGTFLAHSRPWILDSASQFRPVPPPVYGSPSFEAALEEVQRVARQRTPEQTKVAQRWNDADPWAVWNEVGLALGRTVARYAVERERDGGLTAWRTAGVARKQ